MTLEGVDVSEVERLRGELARALLELCEREPPATTMVQNLVAERDRQAARIAALEGERNRSALKIRCLERRETFCSDCFDKVAGQGCWRCKVQSLETTVRRQAEGLEVRDEMIRQLQERQATDER